MAENSEIRKVFEALPGLFKPASVKTARSFYFSLGDEEKWTVTVGPDACTVAPGKNDKADCFIKCTPEFFLDVWSGKKVPGLGDFMSGAIKSNNPLLLKEFVTAFGKST